MGALTMGNLDKREDGDVCRPIVSVNFSMASLTKKLTELTIQLGVEPSHSFQLGDEVNSRTGIHKRGRSVWQLRSEENVISNDLEEHLTWLLNKIEPSHHVIQQYLDDPDVEVVIRINCHCPDSIGGVSIRSVTMQRLAVLSNRIDIGFMGESERDDEENSSKEKDPSLSG
jgi:hypothetical protein